MTTWSYGITTVPSRFETTLPRTIKSLAAGGFDDPHFFVDGYGPFNGFLPSHRIHTNHTPLRTFGNWVTAAWSLYTHNPSADYYAIFQDDIIMSTNVRQYLEQCKYRTDGYWNLYTFPQNVNPHKGWSPTSGKGLGALALVFNNDVLRKLLQSPNIVDRPFIARSRAKGNIELSKEHKCVDGAIVTALSKVGIYEMCHNPSLVQHIGTESTMDNPTHPVADTFRGEEFDALSLVSDLRPSQRRVETPSSSRAYRIGLVGYSCRTGVGELNRQLATYADIDAWYVKKHPHYETVDIPDTVDAFYCQGNNYITKLTKFIKSVDIVLCVESLFYRELPTLCKRFGRKLVLIPMHEWFNPSNRALTQVDLLISPTRQCYNELNEVFPTVRNELFNWPVDTNRFDYEQRTKLNRFTFINGHGGWEQRKGSKVIEEALKIWPEMPINIYSQIELSLPSGVVVVDAPNNKQLYHGDCLLNPSSVDGLCLQRLEALACGMPVISTNGGPWNESPTIDLIDATTKPKKVGRVIDWYTPSAQHLVELCQKWLGQDVSQQSQEARMWACESSWDMLASDFNELVRSVR